MPNMDEIHLGERLTEIEKKVDAIYVSTEKTRKYFLGMLVVTVIAFVLPLIGLLAAIPSFLSTYAALGDLGL